jgi:hypothetical protein
MRNLKQLEQEGYYGQDVDLETSLYEYGLAIKENEESIDFIVGISVDHEGNYYRFTEYTLTAMELLNVDELFSWMNYDYWISIASLSGLTIIQWLNQPIIDKFSDLLSYFSYESIFGVNYVDGFEIRKE